jgi:hypothetical protein
MRWKPLFRTKILGTFYDDLRSVPESKYKNLGGIYRKKSGEFSAGIILPSSSDFCCFPQEYCVIQ